MPLTFWIFIALMVIVAGGMLNACSNACVGGTTPLNLAVPAAIVGGIERLVYMCDVVEFRLGD